MHKTLPSISFNPFRCIKDPFRCIKDPFQCIKPSSDCNNSLPMYKTFLWSNWIPPDVISQVGGCRCWPLCIVSSPIDKPPMRFRKSHIAIYMCPNSFLRSISSDAISLSHLKRYRNRYHKSPFYPLSLLYRKFIVLSQTCVLPQNLCFTVNLPLSQKPHFSTIFPLYRKFIACRLSQLCIGKGSTPLVLHQCNIAIARPPSD